MDARKHALRTVQCALRTMVPNPSPMPPERPALATSSDFSDNFVPFKEEGCWSGGDGSPASGVLSLIRFAVWAGNLSSGAADSRDPSLGVARGNGLSPPHFRVFSSPFLPRHVQELLRSNPFLWYRRVALHTSVTSFPIPGHAPFVAECARPTQI